MRKLLIAVGLLAIILVAALLVVPTMISTDKVKQELITRVETKTGRSLTIDGDVSLSVLPSLSVSLEQVSFANARWSSEPTMIKADELALELSWLPLLTGNIAINSFVLEKPDILLEIHSDGTPNWQFVTHTASNGAVMSDTSPSAAGIDRLQLEQLTIRDGALRHHDHQNGRKEHLTDITMDLRLPGFDHSFSADGQLSWNDKPYTIALDTGSPKALLRGTPTDVALKLEADQAAIRFDGQLALRGDRSPYAMGPLKLESDSLRSLLLQIDPDIALPDQGLGNALIKGTLATEGHTYTLSDTKLALDAMEGSGTISLDGGGAKPTLTAALAFNALDLRPYMEESEPVISQWLMISSAYAAVEPFSWDDTPMNFGILHALNATLDLTAKSLTLPQVSLPDPHLTATLQNAVAKAKLREMSWYGGHMQADIALDASKATPVFGKTVTMTDANLQPMLADLYDFHKFTGKGDFTAQFHARGHSLKDWVSTLQGEGSLQAREGKVVGVNLLNMARNIKAAFTPEPAEGEPERATPFTALNTTFTANQGIITTNDLLLSSPALQIAGNGNINLPLQHVSFTLMPKRAKGPEATEESAESAPDATEKATEEPPQKRLSVPIIVEGPFDAIRFRPDLKAAISGTLKDPKAAEQSIKDIRDNLQDFRKDVGSQIKDIFKPFDKKKPEESKAEATP